MNMLGPTIRQARKAKGWSLEIFSEKVGISIMTLQRIETGRVSPSIRLIIEIAHCLSRPITDFIQDKERTLIRLKSNRIKTWVDNKITLNGIYPEGIIGDKIGLYYADIPVGLNSNWEATDYYKGYHLLEGKMDVEFEDRTLSVSKGETVYFDARFTHRLVSESGAKALVVFRR